MPKLITNNLTLLRRWLNVPRTAEQLRQLTGLPLMTLLRLLDSLPLKKSDIRGPNDRMATGYCLS